MLIKSVPHVHICDIVGKIYATLKILYCVHGLSFYFNRGDTLLSSFSNVIKTFTASKGKPFLLL